MRTLKELYESTKRHEIKSKGGYTVERDEGDNDGSSVYVVGKKGVVIDTGDYDVGAQTFFMNSGNYDEVDDILKFHIKNKSYIDPSTKDFDQLYKKSAVIKLFKKYDLTPDKKLFPFTMKGNPNIKWGGTYNGVGFELVIKHTNTGIDGTFYTDDSNFFTSIPTGENLENIKVFEKYLKIHLKTMDLPKPPRKKLNLS